MLVQCKSCNVSFDLSFGKCIVCGKPALLSVDELKEHALEKARELFRQGMEPESIRTELNTTDSLTHLEIEDIIETTKGLKRQNSREQGRHVADSGLSAIMLGAAGFCLGFAREIHLEWIIMGMIMLILGLFQATTSWRVFGGDD